MKTATRRIILLVTSVLAGGVLVPFDAPVYLVLLNTVMVGCIMLILLGMVRVSKGGTKTGEAPPAPEPKEKPKQRSLDPGARLGALRQRIANRKPAAAPAKERVASRRPRRAGIHSHLCGAVSAISASLQAWRNKEKETEKIDSLLDRALADPLADDFPTFDHLAAGGDHTDASDVEERIAQKIDKLTSLTPDELKHLETEVHEKLFGEEEGSSDAFAFDGGEISGFDLPVAGETLHEESDFDEEDITALDSIDLPEGGEFPGPGSGSPGDMSLSDAFPDLPYGEEEPSANTADIDPSELDHIGDLSDMGFGDEDLADLESIDLGDIEPEAGEREEDDEEAPFDAGDHDPRLIAVEAPGAGDPDTGPDPGTDDDVGSFGFGGDEDADIMQMLKQETRRPRVVQDASLLRDLKDVDVDARELVDELESVLNTLNKKS
ncbi:MAG: hypothetical protein QCH35_00845 [Methanomicrobiaceae archaeon]|nr:hypothetical protein [Methanomicrobiaceae archaeon]